MKTLAQFKSENGIQAIDFLKGKGRLFANVKGIDVIVGSQTDLKKALYVIPNDKGFMTVCNSEGITAVVTL